MRLIVMCVAATWQDDFMKIYDKARRYFVGKFHDWRERDEAVQDALCFLMGDFAKRWEHGKEVVFTPLWAASPVWRGRTFAGTAQRGCRGYRKLERKAMPDDVAATDTDLDWQLDYQSALSKLAKKEQRIVRMFLEQGYTQKEIASRCKVSLIKIGEVLLKLRSLM